MWRKISNQEQTEMTKMMIVTNKDFDITITNGLKNVEKNMNIMRKEMEDTKKESGTSRDEKYKIVNENRINRLKTSKEKINEF